MKIFIVMPFDSIKKNIFKLLEENEVVRNNLWIQIQYNLHLYPPALNENKFIYGKIGENIIFTLNTQNCLAFDDENNRLNFFD